MSSEAAEILEFWQAVEIFSPQEVPHVDADQQVYAVESDEPAPWEPGHQLSHTTVKSGKVWRHVVYGGVFRLSGLEDMLARHFGRDPKTDVDDRGRRRESALFACTLDQTGVLIEQSMVLSACAWAVGACRRSPLQAGELPDSFYADALMCAEALGSLADAKTGSGARLLAASVRKAVPAAVGAAVTAAIAPAFAPAGAVVAQAASAFLAKVAEGMMGGAVDDEEVSLAAENRPPARLESRPLTGADLIEFVKGLSQGLNVRDVLNPRALRVRSYLVSADRADTEARSGFLNSLIAEDLAHVAGSVGSRDAGTGLATYLSGGSDGPPGARIDVRKAPWTVLDGVAPARTPRGRWVADTDRPLTLSQQFAVNEIMANLAGSTGIFAVNGPPGTGKTTILRDLVAAVVVERALRLADLQEPGEAFTGEQLRWSASTWEHKVSPLHPDLTGFEIVVASSNNGAVENVTTEIPGSRAIDEQWREEGGQLDYFAKVAARVIGDGRAWAVVAARLGNRANCQEFANRFWWDPHVGMKNLFRALRSRPVDWRAEVAEFRTAINHVDALRTDRQVGADAIADIRHAEETRLGAASAIAIAQKRRTKAPTGLLGLVPQLLASVDIWRHRRSLASAERTIGILTSRIRDAQERWGARVPAGPQYADTRNRESIEQRERSSPWADAEFTAARTRAFLAALRLHKAFVTATAPRMRDNLNALIDVVQGKGVPPPGLEQMAWQSLFLLVPVVSTTFASFSRMFGRFGADSLGWLLIDEAGQATPQAAVGGIWRARRTVVVGDPLQLEPISSLPWAAERSLGQHFRVGEEWSPGRVSVQQLADRVARYGTHLSQTTADAQPVWVGSPLRVHRRSDRPIFEICNAMAYDGLMVYGSSPRGMFPGRDRWIDVEAPSEKRNWVPAETEQLGRLLERLVDEGIGVDQIRVLSPFRDVINEAKRVHRSVFFTRHTEAGAAAERWVGTVHTMQGKEADVIILVLGGDPGRPGVRAWAAERPNLLNVAVSRARRRLYVIGNRRLWDRERYSRVLVSHLQPWRPSEPVHSLP